MPRPIRPDCQPPPLPAFVLTPRLDLGWLDDPVERHLLLGCELGKVSFGEGRPDEHEVVLDVFSNRQYCVGAIQNIGQDGQDLATLAVA